MNEAFEELRERIRDLGSAILASFAGGEMCWIVPAYVLLVAVILAVTFTAQAHL